VGTVALSRWFVGLAEEPLGVGDGLVAFTAFELSAAPHDCGLVVGFHDAMAGVTSATAARVDVFLPTYRGKTLVPALAWLVVNRLAAPGADVAWHLEKQQGPNSVQRLLASLGWKLEQIPRGRFRELRGQAPATAPEPAPRRFITEVDGVTLRLEADYGVFSPQGLDAGTRLLMDVALGQPVEGAVADIGTGYGPLAIGLLATGRAQRAVATDVDCIALWLALRNAAANKVSTLTALASADPTSVEPTPLTVCNVPTHVNARETATLMVGLLARARAGRLLAVVHRSLEARYMRYFTDAGLRPSRHEGPTHVVLDAVG
jgi:16S rRNA G1207 methylase RsmC